LERVVNPCPEFVELKGVVLFPNDAVFENALFGEITWPEPLNELDTVT
jgi:hypothetical protein